MKHIILAKHDADKTYAFEVPGYMANRLKKGAVMLVETARGEAIAHAVSDVISGNIADYIAGVVSERWPLKPVITYLAPELESYVKRKTGADMIETMRDMQEVLMDRVF